jgi:protein-tyrosine phosphatase
MAHQLKPQVIFSILFSACVLIAGCDSPDQEIGITEKSTESPSRHIQLQGQPNFRDLGGYRTTDGRTVKWRHLYRTGELAKLDDSDVQRLGELGLTTMVNFLLPEEIAKQGPDRLPEGTSEVMLPISGERAARLTMDVQSAMSSGEFEKIPPEMNPEFHRLLIEEGKKQYAALLRTASDPENLPLAFHCSHGIHRTGTATAILLSALGVPWETIREDYLLTNEFRKKQNEVTLARIRAKVADARDVMPESVDMSNVEAFYILEAAYIDGALEAAVQKYGSMEAYIRDGLGISEDEVAALRSSLLN